MEQTAREALSHTKAAKDHGRTRNRQSRDTHEIRHVSQSVPRYAHAVSCGFMQFHAVITTARDSGAPVREATLGGKRVS